MHPSQQLLIALVCLAAGAASGFNAWHGFTKGRTDFEESVIERHKSPLAFWLAQMWWVAMTFVCILVGLLVLQKIWD